MSSLTALNDLNPTLLTGCDNVSAAAKQALRTAIPKKDPLNSAFLDALRRSSTRVVSLPRRVAVPERRPHARVAVALRAEGAHVVPREHGAAREQQHHRGDPRRQLQLRRRLQRALSTRGGGRQQHERHERAEHLGGVDTLLSWVNTLLGGVDTLLGGVNTLLSWVHTLLGGFTHS